MTNEQIKAIEENAPKYANVNIDTKNGIITIIEGSEAVNGNLVLN